MNIDEVTEEIVKDYRNVDWQKFELNMFVKSILLRGIAKELIEIIA